MTSAVKPRSPEYYVDWRVRLGRHRAEGNMDAALAMRREDAEDHGFDPELALDEEREWWTKHKES